MSLYELFIGFRYLKSKKNQGFISFNTLLSILTVFLGVFILIVVISVMNGFQSQIKDRILDVDSHITINGVQTPTSDATISNYKQIADKIKSIDQITAVTPYFQGNGIVKYHSDVTPVLIRGMGSEKNLPADFSKFVKRGEKSFKGGQEIFIGEEMAFNYDLKIGDYIELIVARGRLNLEGGVEPGVGRFKVIGYFKTGYYEFDTKLLIISLPQAQRLYGQGDVVSAIGVKIKDIYKSDFVSGQIRTNIGLANRVFTAEERNQNLFYALKLEKLIMIIILFLVIVSAGFTIMGTLVMVVMEKRRSVGILKSMGATPHSIMTIFILEGFFIGVLGALSGTVAGLLTSINLEKIVRTIELVLNTGGAFIYRKFSIGIWFDISIVPSNVYYIEGIPADIKPEFVVFIAAFAVFLATVSAIFPAWYASRLNPVQTIRYE